MVAITEIGLRELFRHLGQWLTNLRRAGANRKKESTDALRSVIVASRETTVYVRHLNETGLQDHQEEARLSAIWTKLSFRLTDLGLTKLAKRCDIKGRYWSNPAQFVHTFLEKADIGLEKIEKLARQILVEIAD